MSGEINNYKKGMKKVLVWANKDITKNNLRKDKMYLLGNSNNKSTTDYWEYTCRICKDLLQTKNIGPFGHNQLTAGDIKCPTCGDTRYAVGMNFFNN